MTAFRTDRLQLPGANLYYEMRGSGPLLLMIPGGPADATTYQGIAGYLAETYTVVTYDPRGISRSQVEAPWNDESIIGVFADDANRLLTAVNDEPAFLFGTSGGALIGLELALRRPRQVRTLVAHEPPAIALLSDRARHEAAAEDVVATYRSSGVGPAMQKFMVMSGLDSGAPPVPQRQSEPTPEMAEAMAQMQRNLDLFLAHYVMAVATYAPDIEALRRGAVRIVIAVGADSSNLGEHAGRELAERLGSAVEVFPGDHGGYMRRPAEFAAKMIDVMGTTN